MVTKEPNKKASSLSHDKLFDIAENPFSQFLGRVLLGCEKDYRNHFNDYNFLWIHALGSSCHGKESKDGPQAIRNIVGVTEFELIVTFGIEAAEIFWGALATIDKLALLMSKGPLSLNYLYGYKKNKKTKIASFPHVSAQAQWVWVDFSQHFSSNLLVTQEIVKKIIHSQPKSLV